MPACKISRLKSRVLRSYDFFCEERYKSVIILFTLCLEIPLFPSPIFMRFFIISMGSDQFSKGDILRTPWAIPLIFCIEIPQIKLLWKKKLKKKSVHADRPNRPTHPKVKMWDKSGNNWSIKLKFGLKGYFMHMHATVTSGIDPTIS